MKKITIRSFCFFVNQSEEKMCSLDLMLINDDDSVKYFKIEFELEEIGLGFIGNEILPKLEIACQEKIKELITIG